ncbi:MAG: hypothetical protein ACLUE1_02705 [Adlercreutzia equolifaciens]
MIAEKWKGYTEVRPEVHCHVPGQRQYRYSGGGAPEGSLWLAR